MATEITSFVSVEEKARSLGCNVPSRLALLPRNFQEAKSRDELLHEGSAPTVRVLFRANSVVETPLELEGERFPHIVEESFAEWIGPTIFVSASLISQEPHMLSLALGVVSNYLTDFLRRIPGIGNAKLDVVVESRKGSYKRIHYEGPVSGLAKLAEIAKEVSLRDG